MVRLQKDIVGGKLSIPLLLLLVIALRFYDEVDMLSVVHISVLFIHICIAALLLLINHLFTVIRYRTQLPALFFLLITGTNACFFTDLTAGIIALLMTLCLICTLASYQRPDAPKYLFNISVLLSIGSFLWLPAIFFLPLFWVAFFQFRSLTGRSFLASFLGVFVVLLFVFTYGVYIGNPRFVLEKIPNFIQSFNIHFIEWSWTEIARIVYTGVLGIIALLYLTSGLSFEKIRTQAFLFLLYTLILIIIICVVFSDQGKYILLSIFYLSASLTISHLFTLSNKKITAYLLIFSILFYISTYFIAYYAIPLYLY